MATHVRLATPLDAPALVALVRRCYGDAYRVGAMLDAAALAAAIAAGREVYALAFDAAGEHVGQAGLVRVAGGRRWDYCRGVVDVRHRRSGVLTQLGAFLLDEVAPALGAEVVVGIPVTSHPFTQASCRAVDMVPLGLLLGVYPGYDAAGIGRDPQPTSIVLMGRRTAPAPARTVSLPDLDGARARAALAALGIDVAVARSDRRRLGWSARREREIGLVHVTVGPAQPAPLRALDLEGLAREPGCRLLWLDLPIDHADSARLVARARGAGLGHAGLLPCSGDHGADVLRLQRYLDPAPLTREGVRVLPELEALRDAVVAECLGAELVPA
ncbi:MAG: hypothetical protein M9894_38405 [Planctomycetes bacterium]|nr:hypothetical protein [Planctomycetota bacterium]